MSYLTPPLKPGSKMLFLLASISGLRWTPENTQTRYQAEFKAWDGLLRQQPPSSLFLNPDPEPRGSNHEN